MLLIFLARKMEQLQSVEDDEANDNLEFGEISQLYVCRFLAILVFAVLS